MYVRSAALYLPLASHGMHSFLLLIEQSFQGHVLNPSIINILDLQPLAEQIKSTVTTSPLVCCPIFVDTLNLPCIVLISTGLERR
jgi:hypothetical protein